MYTDNLRNKLKQYMIENSCSLYNVEKSTNVHRQCIKKLLAGSGVTYETGMRIRKFIRDEVKFANQETFEPVATNNTTSSSE